MFFIYHYSFIYYSILIYLFIFHLYYYFYYYFILLIFCLIILVELHDDLKQAQILTSCLQRTHETVRYCPNTQCMKISLLNEINAGLCEGMTYEEIKQQMPDV